MGVRNDREIKKRFLFAIIFTALIFFLELIGGYAVNSLALISDAAHVFMDLLSLSLSIFAIYISGLAPTGKKTYGLHRVEVFASFINGSTLIIISAFIFYKAYFRIFNPPQVESSWMLIIALLGLFVNIAVALWLRRFAAADLNVKSAYLHVVGDALASVGVVFAAAIIAFSGLYIVDPVISILIGVIILIGSLRIVFEASHILLEGTPRGVDIDRVVGDIKNIRGVSGVHSLHIWSICHNIHALSAHLDIDKNQMVRQTDVLKEVNYRLAENYHILYTTIQVECPECENVNVLRTMVHKEL